MRFSTAALLALVALAGCKTGGGSAAIDDGPVIPLPLMKDRAGIVAHLPRGSDPASTAERAFKLAKAAELGVTSIREDFWWHEMETSPGAFDPARFEEILAESSAAGISVLPILAYGNPLYSSQANGDPFFPPDDPADYGRYVAAVTGTMGDRLAAYEVWNEENVGIRFWKPTVNGDPDAYGTFLEQAWTNVKARDPSATVVLGGLFGPTYGVQGGLPFLQGLAAAHPDFAGHLDAVGWHPYRYPFTAPEHASADQQPLTAELDDLRAFLDANGAASKPVWITELGWHTAQQSILAGVDYPDQARLLVRSFVLSVSRGVERFFWYELCDGGPSETTDQEQAFGLIEFDPDYTDATPPAGKPAFTAYRELIALLGDTQYAGSIRKEAKLPAGDFGFAFETPDGAKRVVVLWTGVPGRQAQTSVPAHGYGSVTGAGLLGESVALTLAGGRVQASYSESPVYLVFENPPATAVNRGSRRGLGL